MAVDFTKMKKRGDLGWGVFEAEDSTIWKRAGVDGNYTYYGGSTESELEKLSKRREKYKQAEIKRKAKNEPFHNWIKGLFGLESSNVKDKNMANAHENIDNEIMLNTLNRIAQSSSGNWMEGLYKGETRGGEERFIRRTQSRYPNKEAWGDMTMNLNREIRENPSFADTLAQSELPGLKEHMVGMSRPGIIERLIAKIFGQ